MVRLCLPNPLVPSLPFSSPSLSSRNLITHPPNPQLPPVSLGQFGKDFAFGSPSWSQANMRSFILKEVVRQQGDQDFVTILNQCREGNATAQIRSTLDRCNVRVKKPPSDGICATKL